MSHGGPSHSHIIASFRACIEAVHVGPGEESSVIVVSKSAGVVGVIVGGPRVHFLVTLCTLFGCPVYALVTFVQGVLMSELWAPMLIPSLMRICFTPWMKTGGLGFPG